MKHQIKNIDGAVLFEAELPDDTPSGLMVRVALEKAAAARANLAGANLDRANLAWANLARANLAGANLDRANLDGANLARANLARANLDGAYLDGANLDRANLAWANLARANLAGAYLLGDRPIIQIGPIGSRSDYFVAFITDAGPLLRTGCFSGTIEEFEQALEDTHGDNVHAKEYRAALAMIRAHAELWTPATNELKEAA